jgi:hypothetical protein
LEEKLSAVKSYLCANNCTFVNEVRDKTPGFAVC